MRLLLSLLPPAVSTGVLVVAQEAPVAPSDGSVLDWVVKYGLPTVTLVVVVWASARGLIRWGPSVRDTVEALQAQIAEVKARVGVAEQRANDLERENRDLNRFLRNEAVPALTRAADALSKTVAVLDRVERDRR